MLLAYIDESGDTGPVVNGGSLTYTLGCVLVDADNWPVAFDRLIEFRRRVKLKFGIRMRDEIKANYLLRNSGDLRRYGLGPNARRLIYGAHLSVLQQLPARAFGVVVDKRDGGTSSADCFNLAWEAMLQRLEHTSRDEHATFCVMHDEGDNDAVRKWVRKARRRLTAGSAFGPGQSNNPARLLVDDPVPRRSSQSYLIQAADLVAYAAFRAVVAPGTEVARVCPPDMWLRIGSATHSAVSGLRPRSLPGIVLR